VVFGAPCAGARPPGSPTPRLPGQRCLSLPSVLGASGVPAGFHLLALLSSGFAVACGGLDQASEVPVRWDEVFRL